MEIKIDLEDWKCEEILAMHGYMSEEVTAYYENNLTPYDNVAKGTLYPVNIKIAYHPQNKPKELDKEKPMLDILNDFAYDKVVGELFNFDLWQSVVKDY